jgi:alpha-D-xyloside xylohydrolase
MKKNIRAMQVSGLGGFPYFNHDAGGYQKPGPDDAMYIQWGMAFGSFTPIWRPHGDGKNNRWPLNRPETCQKSAMKYSKLRYEMMPYIYTYAHEASVDGMPMARAMVISNQNDEKAWKYDLQYMWGNELLIAPVTSSNDTTLTVWLPKGQKWYSFWNDTKYDGDQELRYHATFGELPVFVKEGSIIPSYKYALSTAQLDAKELLLDVYTGSNGNFALYEDDDVSEKYKTRNESRTTDLIYNEKDKSLIIKAARGVYLNAPNERLYKITLHGLSKSQQVEVNGKIIKELKSELITNNKVNASSWSEKTKTLNINIQKQNVNTDIVVKLL